MNTRKTLTLLLPHCSIIHGKLLDGIGTARLGWHARTASGLTLFLGVKPTIAIDHARSLGQSFGASP